MIHFTSFDTLIADRIRSALEAHTDVTLASDWACFRDRIHTDGYSIAVLSGPPSPDCLDTIREFLPASARSEELATRPVVWIDCCGWMQRNVSPHAVRDIPHEVISLSDVAEMLADAIPRESARAALAFAWFSASENRQLHRILRSAFRIELRSEHPARSIREIAKRVQCSEAALYACWRDEGPATMGLKEFVDLVLLLAARRRKSPRLTWSDVAGELSTELRHLRAVARRQIGHWPNNDVVQEWATLADRLRHSFAAEIPPDRRVLHNGPSPALASLPEKEVHTDPN